jgi:cytochrome P450
MLRDDPTKIPTFVEEALRLECPVQSNMRNVKEDTELAGVKIPEGAVIILRYGAANRDEKRFDDSENLHVDRKSARGHLAFGYGIHTCPGAMLARQEAVSTFQHLLAKYQRFELMVNPEELQYHPTFFLRGLKSLPVRFVEA